MECRISAFSRPGGRERNEDACGYLESGGMVCCVLADGAGGHGGGDVASRLSVQSVLADFVADPQVSPAALWAMLQNANERVIQGQHANAELATMHSTLVVLLFDPAERKAIWGHVGDSRLYMIRNGSCKLHTRDHSVVQAMVDNGMLTEEQAQTHRERNVLVTSVGSQDFGPTVTDTSIDLEEGDAFLLCSDGFWGVIEERCIETSLVESPTPDEWLNRMEQQVSARISEGADNFSAIGIWCGEPDGMRTIPVVR